MVDFAGLYPETKMGLYFMNLHKLPHNIEGNCEGKKQTKKHFKKDF